MDRESLVTKRIIAVFVEMNLLLMSISSQGFYSVAKISDLFRIVASQKGERNFFSAFNYLYSFGVYIT
jgi:hypothetical protein